MSIDIYILVMQAAFMALQFLGLVSMLIISVVLIHVIGTISGGSLYTIMLLFTFNQNDRSIGRRAQCCSTVVLVGF